MKEKTQPEPTRNLEPLIEMIEHDAAKGRTTTLPSGLDKEAYKIIFQTLREHGNAQAIAAQLAAVGSFMSEIDVEWLYDQGERTEALWVIQRYLSRNEDRTQWIARLLENEKDDLATEAIRSLASHRSLPIEFARTLASRGRLAQVGAKLSTFRELDESLALALIREGGPRVLIPSLPEFPSLSRAVADALFMVEPACLPTIGYNLRKFHGLGLEWKQRLLTAGFTKDVLANESSFG